jgi:hypothetical protein
MTCKHDLLREVFVWACERSCQRYLAITQTMVEPDPLKIKYREALRQLHEGSVARYRLRRPEYLAWQLACTGGEVDHR